MTRARLISQADAARRLNVTRQMVTKRIRKGSLATVLFCGRRMVTMVSLERLERKLN